VEGYTFTTTVRVRFADTDAQGIAHNASYLVWYEVARVEYLRPLGLLAPEPGEPEFVMRAQHVEYHAPARFDDGLRFR